MSKFDYDLAVVGAGPAGYKCAIKAAKLGLRVVSIDRNSILGGACLRVGCIPSKALLDYSYKYYSAKTAFAKVGVTVAGVDFDLRKMFEVRDKEVEALGSGIGTLFSAVKVERLCGVATVEVRDNGFGIKVVGADGSQQELVVKNIVIATGSLPLSLPGVQIDERDIVSSDAALSMDLPRRLLVIGGGAIGLEMSSVWSRLGSEVKVVEYSDRIAASMDAELSRALLSCLQKQGVKFSLASKVVSVDKGDNGLLVSYESLVNGEVIVEEVDKVLVAIGRRPFVEGIMTSGCELARDDRGFIVVDDRYETSIKGIFAVGDVIGGLMLAHKAEMEGRVVAELLAGRPSYVDYGVIPSVIYTHPVVASVGMTEDYLKKVGYEYRVGKSHFAANGRARVVGESDGFVKVLVCKRTGVILGVHIVGVCADTIINEAAVALAYRAGAEDICRVCHSHPDVNEAFRDACEVVL